MRQKGFKHSTETKQNISLSNTGKKSSQWKGDNVKYQAIHSWLRINFGRANKCENQDCNGQSKTFEWILIKGRIYERKRENFKMMCKSCHHRYDMSKETKEKISKGLKGRIISQAHRYILSKRMKKFNPSFGGLSKEHKEKISNTLKNKWFKEKKCVNGLK